MSNKNKLMAFAAAAAITLAGVSAMAAEEAAKEKCYGVAKAGANDCGNKAAGHSCAGHSTADASKSDFIVLPAGVCDRLAGGSTTEAAAAPAATTTTAPAAH